ncbi:MAG: sigma-70 family RNA polymerase sigma factor [Bryobacteraceae bacterium]
MVRTPHSEPQSDARRNQIESEVVSLYQEHAAALLRHAASMARSHEASDAVQEAFLRYFVERTYGRVIGHPRAWLHEVLRNYLLDRLKTLESRREMVSEDLDDLPDAREDPEQRLARREITRHFAAALTERELDCLRRRGAGLRYLEIAAMGIRQGTVGALLAHAHRKLEQATEEKHASRPALFRPLEA